MRRISPKAAVALAAVAALLASGCGGGSGGEAEEPEPAPATYLLSGQDIQRLSQKHRPAEAVRVPLQFWRDVQYQNYAAAYLLLSEGLRQAIPYETFLSTVAKARGLFLLEPSVEALSRRSGLVSVDLRAKQGTVATGSDQIIGFNLRRQRGSWVIATDPYNLFRVSPQVG